MTEKNDRRSFLKLFGLTAGASLTGSKVLGAFIDTTEVRKLNEEQQEFMVRYGQWMDEYLNVVRIRKTEPDNMDNHRRMIELTEQAESFQPELKVYMQDETFSFIFKAAIKRVTDEIPNV